MPQLEFRRLFGACLGGLGQVLRLSLQAYARMRGAKHKVDSLRQAARLLGLHSC